MRRLPRHQDIDSQLWPALDAYNPIGMAAKLGCYASIMIVFISWLVLFGVMAVGWIEWAAWPYVVLPIGVWLVLLGLPILWKLRKGSLMILNAIVKTAEAWLSRAGYSIDLNNDGYYGHVREIQVTPVKTETTRAIPWRKDGETKLLASSSVNAVDDPEPEPESQAVVTRHLWELPNGIKCPIETLEFFLEQIFIRGWNRSAWVPQELDRDTYDGLIAQIEQARILEGRKGGFKGKLAIRNANQARMILGLPTSAPADNGHHGPPAGTAEPTDEQSLYDRYQHI
jgi:hypothetical protein